VADEEENRISRSKGRRQIFKITGNRGVQLTHKAQKLNEIKTP